MNNIDFSKIYSVSKLQLFEKCPKAYHFSYLDEVYSKMKSKLRKDPANIWPFQTLGKAVHDAITLFLHLPKNQQTIENLKQQLKIAWRSEAMPNKLPPLGKWGGFKDLKGERGYYRQALEMLINFNKTFNKSAEIKFLPTDKLNRSIEDYKKLIKPISKDFDISGKFDLVLNLPNSSLEVVDFKTGKENNNNNFQLEFYKLLAELNFNLPVEKASFYYLRSKRIKEFDLSIKDIEKIKLFILKKVNKIKKEKEFEPKPSKLCKYCLFRTFCPAKSQVAKFIKEPIQEDFIEDLPF